jgi:prolyl oligopeptidase
MPKTTVNPWDQLFSEFWDFQMQRNPLQATYLGDHRYDDKLPDPKQQAHQWELQMLQEFLGRAQILIKEGKVGAGDSLNAELFVRELSVELEDSKWRDDLMPLTQQSGPQIELPELVTYQPFHTVADCENYVTRLRQIEGYIYDLITNMRMGVAQGLVPAKITIQEAMPQIEAQIVADPEKSVFAEAIAKMDTTTIPAADRERLRAEILDMILRSVVSGFDALDRFIKDEYLKACRDTVGILALPNGKARYENLVKRYTTTTLTPQKVFDLGKKELAWIHEAMIAVKDSLGFKGSLTQFIEHLRTDPQFAYHDADSLMDGFKTILHRMDGELPKLFGRLPKAPYGFREIEAYRADAAPDAYYYPPPDDGSRPGYFYVNTYKPESRPKYTMEALAYHEAVPGHHLQIALQQELTNLPQFRRHGGYTAFIEGWALYAERLPKEIGFYSDPYAEFGRLTLEAWRAARLVVDPGIHYMGWTRDQAVQFFRENTGLSEHNIQSEIDRYIAWPGQATAYKVGQLQILRLRELSREELGDRFDLRAFHDELLSDGALPLDLLERKMKRWADANAKP